MSKLYRTIGPPGCGKTTWLARQCLNAAQKYGGESIAIASLTRTAAAEVASRSTGVPRQNIGTLHSHAFRRLGLRKEEVAETSQGVKDWNEHCSVESWKLSSRSVANPEASSPDDFGWGDGGDELLAEIGVLRARCVDERLWSRRLQGFWKAWTAWKSGSGRLDFTDMICRALESVDGLDVQIMMIDEAQDMSRLEMELARKWGEDAEQLLIVGDPDQTIYEWRGADPSAFYLGEAALTQTLAQSYRVPKAVHRVAVEWIEQICNRDHIEYRPRDEDGSVHVHSMASWKDGSSLANLCDRLTTDGSSVCVLASCGYMLNPLIGELKHRAVPFGNPYRKTWNPIDGKSARQLRSFLKEEPWTWQELWDFVEPLVAEGVLKRGAKAEIKKRLAAKLAWEKQEDRIVEGLYSTTLEFFEEQHQHSVFRRDINWFQRNLRASESAKLRYVCDIAKNRGMDALFQRPKLSVGTIHSYKGGEADKVVLIPDLSPPAAEVYYGNDRDSVIRLFYVGITRSRKELHFVGHSGVNFVNFR